MLRRGYVARYVDTVEVVVERNRGASDNPIPASRMKGTGPVTAAHQHPSADPRPPRALE